MLETAQDLKADLHYDNQTPLLLDELAAGESRFVKDLRINLKNTLESEHFSRKEGLLLALAVAVNERHERLTDAFRKMAQAEGATEGELAETYACTSLLATNNVFYRFRHFAHKDSYEQLPARLKMTIMAKPVLGKEFFELMSLVISAVNGCERCVTSHESSLLQLGSSEPRIFDAVRLGAVVTGLSKVA